jgi:glucose/arabinose dehydrogenase
MKTFLVFVFLLIVCITGYSQSLPTGFNSTNATPGATWNQPVGALFSKDALKLFVWEKGGIVYVCNRNAAGNYIKQVTPVLNISEEVANYNDYGMTGLALDPQFESNGLIYVSYVVDRHYLMNFPGPNYSPTANEENAATIGRITRYATTIGDPELVATPASRQILLGETKETGVPILHLSHGTGSLVFAADGTLLASMGDGASFLGNDIGPGGNSYYVQGLSNGIIRPEENVGAFRSQMLTSLNGKLLRLNPVNGNGVSSNPFYDGGSPRSAKSRIWALGLRNPFRISIKPGAGSLNPSEGHIGEVFIGDVGFGTWEELNVVKEPGMNFGWPLYEGHNPETYVFINTENKEVPIPPSINCGGRQHMRFSELIRQDNAAKDASIYYPCSSTLYSSETHHIHARPVLDWIHANENYTPANANARVGTFNTSGQASTASIGSPASNVTGNVFNGNSSTGGIWYTGAGNTFPPEYKNTFFLADYGEKWIKRVTIENTDKVTSVDEFATNIGSIVCMVENPLDGSLVYVNVGDGSPGSSAVKKISFGGNMPPVAKIKGHTNFSASNDLTVLFDGRDSYDQDGNIANYSWNFDDATHANNTSTNPTPDHHFFTTGPNPPQKYVVKLTVTDNQGATDTDEFIVSINNTPPVVNITSPVKNSKYKVGDDTTYLLKATVTDAQHNASQLTYEWQTILLHNNHSHPEPLDPNFESSSTIARIGCTGENYHWLMKLTVTDAAGLSTIDSSQIYPDCTGSLPIFLHKFSVTQNGSANQVRWTTELESLIEYFELERSSNGINFSPINRQDARNASGPNQYSYDDKSFLPGYNYYRLKIVEQGNVIRYSVIIKTVSESEERGLKVVPNPVVGNFSLTYTALQKDRVTIQVRDVSGKLLHTLKEDVNKGQNVIYMQNLPNWNSGIYFISVQSKDEIKQAKFIKAR